MNRSNQSGNRGNKNYGVLAESGDLGRNAYEKYKCSQVLYDVFLLILYVFGMIVDSHRFFGGFKGLIWFFVAMAISKFLNICILNSSYKSEENSCVVFLRQTTCALATMARYYGSLVALVVWSIGLGDRGFDTVVLGIFIGVIVITNEFVFQTNYSYRHDLQSCACSTDDGKEFYIVKEWAHFGGLFLRVKMYQIDDNSENNQMYIKVFDRKMFQASANGSSVSAVKDRYGNLKDKENVFSCFDWINLLFHCLAFGLLALFVYKQKE